MTMLKIKKERSLDYLNIWADNIYIKYKLSLEVDNTEQNLIVTFYTEYTY